MRDLHLSDDELVGLVLHFEGGPEDALDLPDETIREMIEHIDACAECRAERDRVLLLLNKLRAMPKTPSPLPLSGGLVSRLLGRLLRWG